jgi:hypothetical protein
LLPVPPTVVVVSQLGVLLFTLHVQSGAMTTSSRPEAPAAAPAIRAIGLNVAAQFVGSPRCVTVYVCPPTVSVPIRASLDGFSSAQYCTVLFPLPLNP